MKRLLLAAILALVLPSLGCVGYHRGYDSSYSPGCYSCSHTRERREHGDERGSRHGGHDHGGHHHHDRDDDHRHRHH